MLIASDRPLWTLPAEQRVGGAAAAWEEVERTYVRVPNRPAIVAIDGTQHANFSDISLSPIEEALREQRALGPIASERAITITRETLLTFFDEQLKGGAAESLDALGEKFPEVILP